MSGVHRLLTRRDKKPKEKISPNPGHGDLGAVFIIEDQKKKLDKESDKKIKTIAGRLQRYGITTINEANIEYALNAPSAAGDVEEALRLCLLLEDTYEGLLKTYSPNTKLLGAVNREGVTCYLDALLFAMFARLDSFEAMLYNSLEDVPRKKLAGILRLWVNMLRSGKLITTDITRQLQASLAECGWDAANQLQQQDTSEAFTFITGQLELPLLTLKMDMYHTGKDDPNDDHKFVNERLLEVAILDKPAEGAEAITLEDCLEHYFNNRVEVKRHMEQQRKNSLIKSNSFDPSPISEKTPALHIEAIEGPESPVTPTSSAVDTPRKGPVEQLRPGGMRKRADSIFSQRLAKAEGGSGKDDASSMNTATRTEVLMPAWQFFKLLPWYTDNMPTSDAQVAAHFARKRPVLGICLKRYSMDEQGRASRLDTFVDIPLEISLPDFVSDDNIEEGSPLVGNFKLVLQSVVCHRGRSVHSGHYISLVRGYATNATNGAQRPGSSSSDEDDPWMLFDDLAKERVRFIDIHDALTDECPYLLFYQVQPVYQEQDLSSFGPPSYDEATSRHNSDQIGDIPEKVMLPEYTNTEVALTETNSTGGTNSVAKSEAVDWAASVPPSTRTSMDAGTTLDPSRRRFSTSSTTRNSLAIDDREAVLGEMSGTTTPMEEKTGFLGLPSRRQSRQSGTSKKTKSRPPSQGPEPSNRFSLNMSKLTARMSRGDLPAAIPPSAQTEVASPFMPAQPAFPPSTTTDSEAGSLEYLAPKSSDGSNGSPPSTNPTTNNTEAADFTPVDLPNKVDKARSRKEEKEERKREKAAAKEHHSHLRRGKGKSGDVPDRDCVVM